jgi:hypothetical protein
MNLRITLFTLMLVGLLGVPVYLYIDSVASGGIKTRGDVKIVDLKAMSSFPFDQENGTLGDVPEKWRELDGKRVELVGEMWNQNAAGEYVNQFDLVYSIEKCCFSGPPQVQHFVKTVAKDGSPIPYYRVPVKAVGTLRVNVVRDESAGRVGSVYQFELERLEPASM